MKSSHLMLFNTKATSCAHYANYGFEFVYLYRLMKENSPEIYSSKKSLLKYIIILFQQNLLQLKILKIRNQSNPQNTKNTTKFGQKSPHLNRTPENKPWEKQKICPLRGHILIARFARSSLRSKSLNFFLNLSETGNSIYLRLYQP